MGDEAPPAVPGRPSLTGASTEDLTYCQPVDSRNNSRRGSQYDLSGSQNNLAPPAVPGRPSLTGASTEDLTYCQPVDSRNNSRRGSQYELSDSQNNSRRSSQLDLSSDGGSRRESEYDRATYDTGNYDEGNYAVPLVCSDATYEIPEADDDVYEIPSEGLDLEQAYQEPIGLVRDTAYSYPQDGVYDSATMQQQNAYGADADYAEPKAAQGGYAEPHAAMHKHPDIEYAYAPLRPDGVTGPPAPRTPSGRPAVPARVLCTLCQKPRGKERCVKANNIVYHANCFNCAQCGMDLIGKQYFPRENKVWCVIHYHDKYSPKCYKCKERIKKASINALERTYHPECFVCSTCTKPIRKGDLQVRKKKPYCGDCFFKKWGKKCQKCKILIRGPSLVALKTAFHKECFTCAVCNISLVNVGFYGKKEETLLRGTQMRNIWCHG